MTIQDRTVTSTADVFTDAMAQLVAGLAVVTSRRADGAPGGLLVSSLCSYSVQPPSVLFSVNRDSRSYLALRQCDDFGVHLLGAADELVARVFAGHSDDKFAGLSWDWDGEVPRLAGVPVYLYCRRQRVIEHGTHAIVVGDVTEGRIRSGEPLVYYRRAMHWRLSDGGRDSCAGR